MRTRPSVENKQLIPRIALQKEAIRGYKYGRNQSPNAGSSEIIDLKATKEEQKRSITITINGIEIFSSVETEKVLFFIKGSSAQIDGRMVVFLPH